MPDNPNGSDNRSDSDDEINSDNSQRLPTPEEVHRDFEKFVKEKFGGRVQVFAQNIERSVPNEDDDDDGEEEEKTNNHKCFSFNLKPREIKAYLDRYVVKQDNAKKALAIAVCDHYNQVRADLANSSDEYYKQNVMILGQTGVGKTYLAKHIAKLIGIPFVKADATKFTEAGYVGANVEDLVRDLVSQANNDIKLAQYGIIYLDEVDKLTGANHYGRDISGRGVQIGLLKLMEETEIDLRSSNDLSSQMQAMMEFQRKGKVEKQIVNTKNILFIVSGAFNELVEPIRRRLDKNSIGFKTDHERDDDDDAILALASTQDFIDYGFEPEFIGRIPIRVSCNRLTHADLYEILKYSEGSIIKQYQRNFKSYGIDVRFTDAALRKIAQQANLEHTGARGIMSVCERILRDFKFELPSTEIKEFVVNTEVCADPQKALRKLLKVHNLPMPPLLGSY